MRRRTAIGLLGAGSVGVVVAAALAASPALSAPKSSAKVPVGGTAPSWAASAHAVGKPNAAKTESFSVVLPLRSAATAEQLARGVSDPTSALYHRYLTPKQFNDRFAPSSSSVKKVTDYLKAQGLTVQNVAQGNRWVNASGTVSAVNKAFGTQLTTYAKDGTHVTAPAHTASVPASVKPQIAGITGLDSSVRAKPTTARVAPSGKTKAADAPKPSQCSTYWAQHSQTVPQAYAGKDSYPTYNCGYTPDQLQSAYGLKGTLANGTDGHGVTVGVIDAYGSPTILADANQYSTNQGQPTFAKGQYKQKLFKPFDMQDECGDWSTEQTLDVESVHGIAPGANVFYVGAKNCDTGIDDAANYIVQNHSADIVSNSYDYVGEDLPAAEINKQHSIFIQATVEGIGFYFSSGDYGDDMAIGAPQPVADYAATDPFVTAVGGTSLGIDAGGNYLFETGWGSSLDPVSSDYATYTEALPGEFSGGSGGGTSTLFDQPSYQKRTVPPALSQQWGGKPARTTPDVSMVGDPYTGYLIGQTIDGTYSEDAIGGTSLSTPLFAGVQALASQGAHAPIGLANPTLYSLPKKAYRDVLPTREPIAVTNPRGSYLLTFDRDSTLRTTFGYDNVTGLGSPVGATFLKSEKQIAGWR